MLEHLVAYELYRRHGHLWPETKLYYYRTKHGLEVDLVLEVGRILVFLGARRQQVDGVEVLPLTEFLDELPG